MRRRGAGGHGRAHGQRRRRGARQRVVAHRRHRLGAAGSAGARAGPVPRPVSRRARAHRAGRVAVLAGAGRCRRSRSGRIDPPAFRAAAGAGLAAAAVRAGGAGRARRHARGAVARTAGHAALHPLRPRVLRRPRGGSVPEEAPHPRARGRGAGRDRGHRQHGATRPGRGAVAKVAPPGHDGPASAAAGRGRVPARDRPDRAVAVRTRQHARQDRRMPAGGRRRTPIPAAKKSAPDGALA